MRLIDRDSLKHQIIETYEYEFPTASGAFDEFVTKIIPNIINNAPTIDAAPVVHGKWIPGRHWEYRNGNTTMSGDSGVGCSVCGVVNFTGINQHTPFCPSCGAKMEDKQ